MMQNITKACFPESSMISDVSDDVLLSNTSDNNNADVMATPELVSPGAKIDDKDLTDVHMASAGEPFIPGSGESAAITSAVPSSSDDKDLTDSHIASAAKDDVIEATGSGESAAATSAISSSTGYVSLTENHSFSE